MIDGVGCAARVGNQILEYVDTENQITIPFLHVLFFCLHTKRSSPTTTLLIKFRAALIEFEGQFVSRQHDNRVPFSLF